MKYVVVRDQRSLLLSVDFLCGVFTVSRSGFYKWNKLQLTPLLPDKEDQQIESNVIRVHFDSKKIYGYRKVHKKLENEGIKVSDKKVYRLMAKNSLKAKTKKAFKPRTTDSNHNNKISPRVYLSVFLDLFSRIIVGWAIDDHMRSELVRESFVMALAKRDVDPGLTIHTDRGVQYTANDFRSLIGNLKFIQSMSRKGNCYDNAFAESFFSQMKKELSKKVFETKLEAKQEIFDFITSWYNTKRIHSSLGYLSPKQFEDNFEAIAS
jgi:putative transposase